MIEKAKDCNYKKNYICEMQASTSTFSIIHIEVTPSTLSQETKLNTRALNNLILLS